MIGAEGDRMTGRLKPAPEAGFAMLLVFLMAAFIAISLYMQIPRVAFQAQRQKEQLLIERGEQYKRAIQVFVRTNGRYPGKIEDLENFNNRRFLRHRFVDPMTGSTEWRLIHVNGGVFTDSIVNQAKPVQPGGSGSVNNFVGEQAYVANDGTQTAPGAANAAGRRRQSEGGAVPLGPDGQPLFPANPGQPPDGGPGGAPINGQFPGADQQGNVNGQPGDFPGGGQLGNGQPGAPFNPAVPGAPGQLPAGIIPGFPTGAGNNTGAPGQPDATGNPNPGSGGRLFQARQMVNQQGTIPPDGQPGGIQQPGFPQPGAQPGGIQQPGFQQNGTPFGGQPAGNNQSAAGSSSFVGSSSSFVGSSQSFVGGGGSTGSQPNGGLFPTPPQNPGFGQNPAFGQQPGIPQQPGQIPTGFNNQPNFPQGGATPYQANPATSNAAANLINGILTNPRQATQQGQSGQPGQTGNPVGAPVGQQIGGGVAGVASTAQAPSIMVYNDRSKYNEWEFIFDLSKQRGLINPNLNMPNLGQNNSAPLAVGTGAPGVAVSASPSAAAMPAGSQVPLQPTYNGGGLNAGGAGPVIPGQGVPGQGLPGQQQGGLPPGFRLGRP
jgi:type II secretory pathway pseudopilin PulG